MEHAGSDGSGDGDGDRRGGAGHGKGRGAPGVATRPQEPLRRPRQHNSNDGRDFQLRNSNLSAEAPVFVPRNVEPNPYMQQQQQQQQQQSWYRHSAQDRIHQARNQGGPPQQQHMHQRSGQYHYGSHHQQRGNYGHQSMGGHYQGQQQYNDFANQSYPRARFTAPQCLQSSECLGRYLAGNKEYNNVPNTFTGVMRELEVAMHTLNGSPGLFDDLVVPVVCGLTPYLKTSSQAQDIVDRIIEQSIKESNFRYSGARLCAHLDAADPPADDGTSIFRTALYNRCREATEKETLHWQEEQDEKSCHGLMLCLAELVAQMDHQPAGSILGKLLVQLISVTLKHPAPNSAKFICQSLKLSGQYLERDSSTNREEIERVMRELTNLVTEGRVDVHIGRMVNSVCELRNGNWGRVSTNPSHGPTPVDTSSTINEQQIPQHSFDEPVLYGPDGSILSAEESSFCQDRATADEMNDDGGDGTCDGLRNQYEDEDEDDAIAAAYEEFLKLEPNKSGSRTVDRG